jgi:hypothetical protein
VATLTGASLFAFGCQPSTGTITIFNFKQGRIQGPLRSSLGRTTRGRPGPVEDSLDQLINCMHRGIQLSLLCSFKSSTMKPQHAAIAGPSIVSSLSVALIFAKNRQITCSSDTCKDETIAVKVCAQFRPSGAVKWPSWISCCSCVIVQR